MARSRRTWYGQDRLTPCQHSPMPNYCWWMPTLSQMYKMHVITIANFILCCTWEVLCSVTYSCLPRSVQRICGCELIRTSCTCFFVFVFLLVRLEAVFWRWENQQTMFMKCWGGLPKTHPVTLLPLNSPAGMLHWKHERIFQHILWMSLT